MASLSSLLKKATLDDHEAVLAASEAVLETSKNDSQAQQARAIALLKLERYGDALKHFEANTNLKSQASEAYAYCLYRSGKYEEAAKVASSVQNSRGAQHIAVQAAYRSDDWDTANQFYKEIATQAVPEEAFDLKVNKLALDSQGLWAGKLKPVAVARATTDDLSAFETAYNAACIAVAKGQLSEADVLLKRAISLCEHHEELSVQEKAIEIVPLKAQRMFVLQQLDKRTEAESLGEEIKSSVENDSLDPVTRQTAQNNILTSTSEQSNAFLASKLFQGPTATITDKLFDYQSIPLSANAKTVDLNAFKYDGLTKSAKQTLSKAELPSTSSEILLSSMFDVAARARNEVGKAAIRKVLPEVERRPNDLGLIMTLVQMYALTGDTTSAINLMEDFCKRLEASTSEKDKNVRFAPGLVSCVVGLYKSQGRKSQIKTELTKAAAHWRSQPKPPPSLLTAAGVTLLSSSSEEDMEAASEIFDMLYKQQPNDKATIAGYVASHTSNLDSIMSLADKLTPVSELTAGIDVSSLEAAGIPQSANALAIAQAGQGRKRAAADGLASQKKKRVRKSRLPKNYDPKARPDPERWLPLRDRSTYRPKGKKKGKKDDRTQGGGVVNESLDISSKAAASEVVTGTGGGGGGKKKKGKGKK